MAALRNTAEVIRHVLRLSCLNDLKNVRYASSNRVKRIKKIEITNRDANQIKSAAMRAEAEKQSALHEGGKSLQSISQSLSTRGYLRAIKPYSPPEDVEEKIYAMAKTSGISSPKQVFADSDTKFAFLSACNNAFGHSVPNSMLHDVQNVEDAVVFYQSSVDTRFPLDAIPSVKIPENLYIQQEHLRFHPDTDTMFGGKSAFPKSSTVVTGLKYKLKYRGHEAKKSWP